MSRLFISHSSRNNAEALALQAWLERHGGGKQVFGVRHLPGRRR